MRCQGSREPLGFGGDMGMKEGETSSKERGGNGHTEARSLTGKSKQGK